MKRMEDFINEIRVRYNIKTQTELAAKLGLTQATISAHYNRSKRAKHYSEKTAHRIAELLGEDPLYVLACLSSERAKDPKVRQQWQRMERILRGVTASILLALFLAIFVPSKQAIASSVYSFSHNATDYTLCALRKLRYWLASLVSRIKLSFGA